MGEASVIGRATSRYGEPLRIYDDLLYIKLGGKETGGHYSLIEDVTIPKRRDSSARPSSRGRRLLCPRRGLSFEANGKRFEAHADDFVFVPRDVPHRFRNIGQTAGAMLLTLEPAGLELFFEELARVTGPPDPAKVASIFEKYGLELLGPPLVEG
jgi:cupin domain